MKFLFSAVITALFFLFLSPTSTAQLNMTLQDSMTYTVGVNDVCGWVAEDGTEYALVGLNTGVSIVDITPDTIKQVAFVPGVNNLWRDINTYGHYAYVSSEAKVGLLIIDLQFLPDSVQTYVWADSLPTPNGPKPFEKAHTLWTDELGICYLNGSSHNSGGVVLIDVKTNPTDPIFLGYAPAIYSHDCYTRDSIIYSAEIYAGNLSIYDARDPSNITLIGRVKTPSEFTHNSWLSDNGQYMFTTDERANAFVTSYDISDPANPIELDRYRHAPTNGAGDIPHNVYVWNDWIVVAYYSNGTIILDGSRPDNLVEVGNFDSYLGPDGGFPGVWGSYPFLPSGKILSSDRNSGLYVFHPNYVRACFLEGTVIDSITGLPVSNAEVIIESDEIILPVYSQFNGEFKMGKAVPGQYNIRVTKEGYYDKILNADFINGDVLTPVIELSPLPIFTVSGKVVDQDNAGVPFAKVILIGDEGAFEAPCDENGDFLLPAVYGGTYEVQSGIWGQTYESSLVLNASETLTLQLAPGYYDDFDLDLGWTVSGSVSKGEWARGVPTAQKLFDNWDCGSGTDSPHDAGSRVYSTGLSTNGSVTTDEVNGGTTWLVSPPMDFDSLVEPQISFDYWLCEFPPNQFTGLRAWLSNGQDTILLEEFSNDTINGSWQSRTYDHFEIDAPLDEIRFMISATDTTVGQNEYILKAHLDRFKAVDLITAVEDPYAPGTMVTVYPNPVTGQTIYLIPKAGMTDDIHQVRLYDLQGRLMSSHVITPGEPAIEIKHGLMDGMYLVQWETISGKIGMEKIVVGN